MGEFDFGAFKELFEYLAGKLSEGGALTPEEQKAYDGLMAIANQGLNLTETADFKSLYTAFNTLADKETKQKFEELYGTGLIEDPASGAIQFTRPGTLVAAMMRKGQSIKDGPIQALLSEGMRNFLDTTAKNSFSAMTNSYQAMTPIRGQNVAALQQAGGIGSTAIGRRGLVAGGAIGGARGGGGAGEAVGAEGANLPLPQTAEAPGAWDKIWPMLLGIVGTGGMAALTPWLAGLMKGDKKTTAAAEPLEERGGSRWWDPEKPAIPQADAGYGETAGWAGGASAPFTPNYAAFGEQGGWSGGQAMPYNPYEVSQQAFQAMPELDPSQYYGMGDQGWTHPNQQPYDYQDYAAPQQPSWTPPQPDWTQQAWNQPQQNYDYSYQDYSDYGQDYNYNYGPSYDDSWAQDYDYSYSGGDSYYPSSDDWYTENW